jgi:Arc/MetJ-type ribon-helix-helix transcriptional regulator
MSHQQSCIRLHCHRSLARAEPFEYAQLMTIELNPEAEAIIQKQLQSGAFANPQEIIERALEFLALEEDWLAANRSQITAQVREGWDAAQSGDLIDAEQARADLVKRKEAWLAERRQQ